MSFQPLSTRNSTGSNYDQVNNALRQMQKEQTTKVYKQAGGVNAVVQGFYMKDRYGTLYYDTNGIPSMLQGQAPDDGRMGFWQANPGENVITLLGG